jgi:hypothetical protein
MRTVIAALFAAIVTLSIAMALRWSRRGRQA